MPAAPPPVGMKRNTFEVPPWRGVWYPTGIPDQFHAVSGGALPEILLTGPLHIMDTGPAVYGGTVTSVLPYSFCDFTPHLSVYQLRITIGKSFQLPFPCLS